ncbi:DUF4349 domain-containing protein [Roseateles sp. So40a]|uniref:DUF4349 domain-containing protein n=1 Tax=Roseateles sp. So40a TaxID=3400226 RepID=UPI003A8A1C5F
MNRSLIACVLLAVLAGCSGRSDSGSMGSAAKQRMVAAPDSSGTARRTLAYEHSIQIEVPEERIATVHQAALTACHQARADACEVLESRVSSGRRPSASLRFRAKPAGIPKLIAALGQQGEITGQFTQAEDLAGPIQDTEKKLAMLTSYRAELETLRKRPGNDVDALIKVTHELASVQSELEAVAGKQAQLMQRVETETLHIAIEPAHGSSFWRPIAQAGADFSGSLSQGISSAITGLAYLLPWSLIIGILLWLGRTVWRRRKATGPSNQSPRGS